MIAASAAYFRKVILPLLGRMPWLAKVGWIADMLRANRPPMIVSVYSWGLPTAEIFGSRVWRTAIPHIEAFWSFSPTDRRPAKERAAYILSIVKFYRDGLKAAHPDLPFRYTLWPHRFGEPVSNDAGNLFESPVTHRDFARAVLAELAAMLAAEGIDPPLAIDPDCEIEPACQQTDQPARSVERHARMDAGLGFTLYGPAKEVWPQVLCGNWATFGSTAQHRVHNWRPNESPVGLGETLTCDIQIPVVYGNTTKDPIGAPGPGADTFDDQITRFGIDPAALKFDPDATARAIHLGRTTDYLLGIQGAKPDAMGFCIRWVGDGIWTRKETYTDPAYFPKWYLGATLDYNAHPELVQQMFALFREKGVKVLNIYAQQPTRAGLDAMADVLASA